MQVYLGIDVGSVTTRFVLLDNDDSVISSVFKWKMIFSARGLESRE